MDGVKRKTAVQSLIIPSLNSEANHSVQSLLSRDSMRVKFIQGRGYFTAAFPRSGFSHCNNTT